jgi:hypothetical protein
MQQLPNGADDTNATVKQIIDPANAGIVERDLENPAIFTYKLPCALDLRDVQPTVALNVVNDAVAQLIRQICYRLKDAVILDSSGTRLDDSVDDADDDLAVAARGFHTALALLGEIASILSVDSLENVAAPALTDCMKRVNAFLDEYDKDRSVNEESYLGKTAVSVQRPALFDRAVRLLSEVDTLFAENSRPAFGRAQVNWFDRVLLFCRDEMRWGKSHGA